MISIKNLSQEQEMQLREIKDNHLIFLNKLIADLCTFQETKLISCSAENEKELVLAKAGLEGARRLAADFNRFFLDFSKNSRK